jgi:hypothetical protein
MLTLHSFAPIAKKYEFYQSLTMLGGASFCLRPKQFAIYSNCKKPPLSAS